MTSIHKRVAELLEVLEFIWDAVQDLTITPELLREARIAAVTQVAQDRGIEPSTVSNKFRREIGLKGTEDFDRVVFAWLIQNSAELEQRMKLRSSPRNHPYIEQFFQTHNPRWSLHLIRECTAYLASV